MGGEKEKKRNGRNCKEQRWKGSGFAIEINRINGELIKAELRKKCISNYGRTNKSPRAQLFANGNSIAVNIALATPKQ